MAEQSEQQPDGMKVTIRITHKGEVYNLDADLNDGGCAAIYGNAMRKLAFAVEHTIRAADDGGAEAYREVQAARALNRPKVLKQWPPDPTPEPGEVVHMCDHGLGLRLDQGRCNREARRWFEVEFEGLTFVVHLCHKHDLLRDVIEAKAKHARSQAEHHG